MSVRAVAPAMVELVDHLGLVERYVTLRLPVRAAVEGEARRVASS
jgi:hypothetical protein